LDRTDGSFVAMPGLIQALAVAWPAANPEGFLGGVRFTSSRSRGVTAEAAA
jgi:hypothetical protein